MARKLNTGRMYEHVTASNRYVIRKVDGRYVFTSEYGAGSFLIFDSYAALAQHMECAKGVPMRVALWREL